MNKKVLITLLLALTLILASCSQKQDAVTEKPQEEAPQSQEEIAEADPNEESEDLDPEAIKVDPDKIVVSDKIVKGYPLREDAETTKGYIENSYHIVESQSYEDTWYREYEVLYPEFTDEITGDGAEKIKEYYTKLAENEKSLMQDFFKESGIVDEVFNSEAEKEHFYFKNYTVKNVGKYLVVEYNSQSFTGGAHGYYETTADNFDTETGDLITLDDLFDDKDAAYKLINEKVTAYAKENNYTLLDEPLDIATLDKIVFEITETGITFIFNPYEIAPYSDGIIITEIPFADFGDNLKITV